MYSYYDVLKEKYQDNIKLIYTDTDSYVLQTFTDDIYKDWMGIKNIWTSAVMIKDISVMTQPIRRY